MRIGKVSYNIEYVVDLDDEEMVERAKDAILEDAVNAVFKGGSEEVLAGIALVEDPSLSRADIPDFLSGEEEE